MTNEEYEAAARYWEEKDAASVKVERDVLWHMAEEYILANNTCALATGAGDYVRCTPIEYSWMKAASGCSARAAKSLLASRRILMCAWLFLTGMRVSESFMECR